MIQVSSGLLRGIPLRSPSGPQTRPSSERLRQGIFNVLRHYRWGEDGASTILEGAIIADVFAGTGAWGIEALSNGAAEAWFVESHVGAQRTLQENLATASRCFESQGLARPALHLLRRDALTAYKKLPLVRLMFCDPPYEKGWFERMVRLEAREHRIEERGLFLYEARDKEPLPAECPTLRHFDTKIYGDSAVHFFVKTS